MESYTLTVTPSLNSSSPLFADERTKYNTYSHEQRCGHKLASGLGYLLAVIRSKQRVIQIITRNHTNMPLHMHKALPTHVFTQLYIL